MLRWPIIIAAIVLTGIASSGTLLLEFSTDHLVCFSENNPQLLEYQTMDDTYGRSDNVFFAIVPEDRDATSFPALEATEWFTERAWQVSFASCVNSITNFQHTRAAGDEILVRELVDESAFSDAEERSRICEIALAEPVLAGRLPARDGGVS